MEKYFDILNNCPLFKGIANADIPGLLTCLGASVRSVAKDCQILTEGDPASFVGILLSGSGEIVNQDIYGNRSIISRIQSGELFGESFACAGTQALPVSVIACQPCDVMLIDCRRITTSCTNACSFHNRMIFNLLQIVASRNLEFHQKLEIMSQRSTRDKLMTYLLSEAKRTGSKQFTIPYNRQALADYLGVERSAMSVELSKLQKDGILKTNRSHFILCT